MGSKDHVKAATRRHSTVVSARSVAIKPLARGADLQSRPWRLSLPYRGGRFDVRTQPLALAGAAQYVAQFRYRLDPGRGRTCWS
jgi:hypothetical protein